MHRTCNGSKLSYSQLRPSTPRSLPRRSLLSLRGRGKVRHAEMLIGFTWRVFSESNSWAISQELPHCGFLFLVLLNYWFLPGSLVTAFGMFGFLHPLQMAAPLLSPLVAEEETKITQRSGGAPESSKPSWASPQSLTAAKTPRLAREKQAAALPARIRATLVPTCSPGTCGVRSRSFWSERAWSWGIFFSLSF